MVVLAEARAEVLEVVLAPVAAMLPMGEPARVLHPLRPVQVDRMALPEPPVHPARWMRAVRAGGVAVGVAVGADEVAAVVRTKAVGAVEAVAEGVAKVLRARPVPLKFSH